MIKIICWMYNHYKWWTVWWHPPLGKVFYEIHARVCPDMKPDAVW